MDHQGGSCGQYGTSSAGTMVSNVATRHPAMLAKLGATVDAIYGRRVDVGWVLAEEMVCASWITTRLAFRHWLRESVEVITGLFRDQHLTYYGTYDHLEDAPLVPL